MNNGGLKDLLKRIKLNESTISTILGALVIVIVGALIVNYFRGVGQPEEEKSVSPEEIEAGQEEPVFVEGLPTTHQVAAGESLWQIAENYYGSGYNWVSLVKENQLANPDHLLVGQELTIPRVPVIKPAEEVSFGSTISGSQYTVVKGDHLWGIAVRAYGDGYQWAKIAQANGLTDPDLIHVGNQLVLPR